MKYILTIITIILIAFISYMYINKNPVKQLNKINHNTTTKKNTLMKKNKNQPMSQVKPMQMINHKEKYETFIDENGEKITLNTRITNHEVKIPDGLTFEKIENSDLSEEEKEILLADMIYYGDMTRNHREKPLTHTEALDLIRQDLENGLIE